MTKEMTAHYQKHATLKDKKEQLEKMPDFMHLSTEQKVIETNTSDQKIEKIKALIGKKQKLSDFEKQILEILK